MNYSFKHNFNFPYPHLPIPPTSAAAVAAPAAGALPSALPGHIQTFHSMPYDRYGHGPGYSGRAFRPRFGLFRRALWFSLGVGAASWYINKKQAAHQRMIESGDVDSKENTHRWGWKEWNNYHHPSSPSKPSGQGAAPYSHTNPIPPIANPPVTAVQSQTATQGQDDISALRSTVDRLISEKASQMGEMQSKAKVDAREYARERLDKLSAMLEGLKESLSKEVEGAKKLV